jgi:hypothetical protein
MFTFLRVECLAHGMGPYRYLHASPDADCQCVAMDTFGYGPGRYGTPTPEGDPGIARDMRPSDRCAFLDIDQASSWFEVRHSSREVYIALDDCYGPLTREESMWCGDNGGREVWRCLRSFWASEPMDSSRYADDDYILAVYEIPAPFVTAIGRAQILVNLDQARRVCQMSIETLAFLEA